MPGMSICGISFVGKNTMKIIVGLGNPGKEYENTKHNIGFMVLDRLAEKWGIAIRKIKFKGLYGEGFVDGEKVILLKPQTYMNLSGESVREILGFYKIDPEDLVVIYDDLDLPMGALRIRGRGSAGTHNGMRSVIYQIQEDGFPRIRVGIGGERKGSLVNYVISGFSGEDRDIMREAVLKAADAAECLVREGLSEAMNRFNTKKKKKKKKEEDAEQKSPADEAETPEEPAVNEPDTEAAAGPEAGRTTETPTEPETASAEGSEPAKESTDGV